MNKSPQSLELKEKLLAGKSALEEKEIPELIDDLCSHLTELISQKKFDSNSSLLEECKNILTSVSEAELAKELMCKIDVEIFFLLGSKFLSSKLDARELIHEYLNLFRYSEFLRRIYEDKRWEGLTLSLIVKSDFNFAELFYQRVKTYKNKSLFKLINGNTFTNYSWNKCSEIIEKHKLSFSNILSEAENKSTFVAFLLDNSLDMALLDIACLTSGIRNAMIPANSVTQHIEFILNETKSEIIFVHDEKQLSKIKSIKNNLPFLKKAVLLIGSSAEDWVINFNQFKTLSSKPDKKLLEELRQNLDVNSLATIMYTSGTTGEPKGIMFSQLNIVYKRFCRAMAIPEIGDEDRYLSFLPLFHTFGRYLEMTGAIFWGAEYAFMENPSVETMIENMSLVKPTIFISIPKKWMQLYDSITSKVDIEVDSDDKIKSAIDSVTGGSLKWGLSAAGYLPPDNFIFFQKYGIELMSGFGMTEATGGITMTPPKKYIPNSLGKALPGIETKVAEDGELLIRGSYVMMGYFGEEHSVTFDNDGWLPTGDIMTVDKYGFIEIIDRKKEIYKNIRGETVAPQKIENLFRDFEYVKQIFLVGDHRPFNTVLIYPDNETPGSLLNKMDDQQRSDYFSTVIVTVNNFLAPFERILDFKIIDRPFSDAHGELTPKGTYKRRVIEKNFEAVIESMYEKTHIDLHAKDFEILVPNWFLREKGALSRDIVYADNQIRIPKLDVSLTIEKIDSDNKFFRIGSYIYQILSKRLDLQEFLTNPIYWLGNKELYDFAGETIIQWSRKDQRNPNILFHSTIGEMLKDEKIKCEFLRLYSKKEFSLYALNYSLLLIQANDPSYCIESIVFLKTILADNSHVLYGFVLATASRPQLSSEIEIGRAVFSILIPHLKKEKLKNLFINYLKVFPSLPNDTVINHINKISKGVDNLIEIEGALEYFTKNISSDESLSKTPVPYLFNLLVQYGIQHPVTYKRLRRTLLHYEIYSKSKRVSNLADKSRLELRKGLRAWLGENQQVAIDPETGEEYSWEDVLVFDESIDVPDKFLISNAIIDNPVIREAIFLFSDGALIVLSSILPSGVWISLLSSSEERSIYRITIHTRFQGAFDFTLHHNKVLSADEMEEEFKWLILSGGNKASEKIASQIGGRWDEYDLWTEEYLAGESVAKYIQREYKVADEVSIERLHSLWRYFVWNASSAYFKFWRMTNYNLELEDCSVENIIVPSHDYQTGSQITSFYKRRKNKSYNKFFSNFYTQFVVKTESEYPEIKILTIWSSILSSICEVEGVDNGIEIILKLKKEITKSQDFPDKEKLLEITDLFLKSIKENGFKPQPLYFAIKRFLRWFRLNEDASLSAQAETLRDLYETYRLFDVEEAYPATRNKFFLETVFSDSSEKFKNVLKDITKKQIAKTITSDQASRLIQELNSEFELTEKEHFFLTRLTYPHLKPTDFAAFLKIKGDSAIPSGLVVQFRDNDGNPFLIRNPISPKEISRLHKLFIEANLIVNFRTEHQYLVALSDRGFIIGGLFYSKSDDGSVHMDKIVVSDRYRKKAVSEGLMNELFSRMKSENIKYVTTGFFRPEYFYRFGFKIERKYSGLVKEL